MIQRVKTCLVVVTLAAISCSCGGRAIRKTTHVDAKPVVKEATREELLDQYNQIARNVKSLNGTVELKPTAGSKYSGVIDEYHEVKAFLLAEREAQIRVIGQAPVVGTTVFDMASDGESFAVSIPSKKKFIVGPVALEKTSSKPIENLRPQHLLDALLWPEVRKEEAVLLEEFNGENARFYVLTVLRGGYQTEILRKIWFDRVDLHVARLQTYGPKGMLLSDVRFADWEPLDGGGGHSNASTGAGSGGGSNENMVAGQASGSNASVAGQSSNSNASAAAGPARGVNEFARTIRIERPHDDYTLNLQVLKIALNEEIPAERFKLEQPSSEELVRVGEGAEKKQP